MGAGGHIMDLSRNISKCMYLIQMVQAAGTPSHTKVLNTCAAGC